MSPLWVCSKVKSLCEEEVIPSFDQCWVLGCRNKHQYVGGKFLEVHQQDSRHLPRGSHHHDGWGNGGRSAEVAESNP